MFILKKLDYYTGTRLIKPQVTLQSNSLEIQLRMVLIRIIIVLGLTIVGCWCQNELPPKMISIMSDHYITEGNKDPLTVQCEAMNGNITYTWKKDGQVVQNSLQVKVDPKTGKITFEGVDITDFGSYQCFAENKYGKALSNPFKLDRAKLLSFSTGSVERQQCTSYKYCAILCRDKPLCTPEAECRVEWKIGEGTDLNVDITERVAVDGKGTLHFLYLDPSKDLKESGGKTKQYGCGLWNEIKRSLNKGSLTEIDARGSAGPVAASSRGIHYEDDTKKVGGTAILNCIFTGYPIPQITWKNKGLEDIKHNQDNGRFEIFDYGRKLRIKNLKETDEGSYQCTGTNSQGASNMNPYLNVTSAPFLNPTKQNQMQEQIKPVGKNVVFTCDAISLQNPPEDPPTDPQWLRNGEEMPVNQIGPGKKYMLSSDKRELTIMDVQKGVDTASFQCYSENSEGMMFKDALLSVIDPIILEYPLEGERSYQIMPGDSLNIGALANPIPGINLIYSWEFQPYTNDDEPQPALQKVQNNAYWTLINGNKNLSIDTSVFSNDEEFFQVIGTYIVRIFHNYDAIYVNMEVTTDTTPPPAPLPAPPATANLWYLAVIFGAIILIIVILLIIYMQYYNRGGQYKVDEKEVAAGHDPEKELEENAFKNLSRGEDDDALKPDRRSLTDDFDKDMESDDDSMGEYGGDLDTSKFNEDGSFIGLYVDKKSKQPKTESNV